MASTGTDGEPRTWAIGDLTRRASRAVVLDFRGPVRVGGELTRLRDVRGGRRMELVERGGGRREGQDAHLAAYCTPTRWACLAAKLAGAGVELREGQRVVLVGRLDIDDRGSLTLTVDDVDVDTLVGDRVRDRRRLVQRLIEADLFDANRRLALSPVPLRVGLVASFGTDGHRDLVRQLDASGWAFVVTLRSVPVEGPAAPRAIAAALATFGPGDVDVVVVVRGGGAKASLDVFDGDIVAHAVATAAVPVWTGIGHTGDRTVADEVAHRCWPTPSATGQALVAAVTAAADGLAAALARIARLVDAGLARADHDAAGRRQTASALARSQLARHESAHARASVDLRRGAGRCLDARSGHLTVTAARIRAAGGVELRQARRHLGGLALDAAGAAGRRCADAAAELAVAAMSTGAAAESALDAAAGPLDRNAALLGPARFEAVLDTRSAALAATAARVRRDAGRGLDAHVDRAGTRRAVLEAYDPRRQLGRGWTLTHAPDGRLIRTVGALAGGDVLVTTFADGTATSVVTEIDLAPGEPADA